MSKYIHMNNYIIVPPWETIEERLEALNMSVEDFRIRMGMTDKDVCNLIKGKYRITPIVAKHLEYVIDIPQSFWLNLEKNYRDKFFSFNEAKWICCDGWFKCSECEDRYVNPTPFCPSCGCSMQSVLG